MGDLDNDMDELFRKAANHYPLKTDGADWDKIAGKLPNAVSTPLPFTEQKKEKSNRKLLWLILLFPMGWLCNAYFNGKNTASKSDTKIVNTTSINQLDKKSQTADNQNNNTNKNDIKSDKVIIKESSSSPIFNPTSANNYSGHKTFGNATNTLNNGNSAELDNYLKETHNITSYKTAEKIIDEHTIATNNLNNGNGLQNNANTSNGVNPLSNENKNQPTIDSTLKLAKSNKDTVQPKTTDTTKNITKKADKRSIEKSNGFYVSVLGGVDASSVKSQGIKKTGYSYGMLIGYNLNKHIAFETGLLWDKKQYYTDGAYFNKTRTSIPSTITLSDMNGNCNMFELPISFRYNIRQNKKTLFFGTAGLSSYFMKKEAYSYEAEMNGNSWYAMKTYNNSGNNLFSIVNLSVGYEHKIGKLVSMRINPYLNIPLKGLGIGSLPITSSGVNIGITVPFHK